MFDPCPLNSYDAPTKGRGHEIQTAHRIEGVCVVRDDPRRTCLTVPSRFEGPCILPSDVSIRIAFVGLACRRMDPLGYGYALLFVLFHSVREGESAARTPTRLKVECRLTRIFYGNRLHRRVMMSFGAALMRQYGLTWPVYGTRRHG